jgi:PAS domain S-box-containing protein
VHLLALLPLVACVVCSAYCLTATPATYNMGNRRLRWLGKALFACPAVWAFCEVGLALAGTPEAAADFVAPASTALVLIGPIAVDTGHSMSIRYGGRLARGARIAYAVAAVLVLTVWTTPWCHRGVTAVPWGYALDPGPLYPAYFGFVAACGVVAWRSCREVIADTSEIRPDTGGRSIAFAIAGLIVIGTVSDGVLPTIGIEAPRLATTGFALLAGWLLWSMSRPQGYVFASQAIISREILRSIHEGVVFVTPEDRVLLANEGMETFVGASAAELVGRPFQPYIPDLSLAGPQERIDVECALHPASGAPITVAASVSTARDHRGEPLGLVVVVRDLRQVELLRNQLVTSGRLAAVGQLAAGIAHEINNPLAFVRTNLGVLREHWAVIAKAIGSATADEAADTALRDGEEIISESIEGVDRAAHIVRDVREFSHSGRPERERVDVNDLLDRVLRISRAELGRGLLVQREYARLPLVDASPQQLKQVFLNLVVNAVHATRGDGTIWVRTAREGERVVVRIADDGSGVPAEVADRIFDPFFTTKDVGDGTGLGLSISHQIVQSHGGELELEHDVAPGACFRVTLPIDADPDAGGRRD